MLSDFVVEDGERLLRALLGLARRHDPVALHLVDPAETELPRAGLLEVEDPETGVRRVLDLAARADRDAVQRLAERQEERLAELFRRSRVDRVRLRTDRPYEAELAGFFAARVRHRR